MKIAFDIGGVLSKYPDELRQVVQMLHDSGAELHVITDMHERNEVIDLLANNGFGFIPGDRVHCADYVGHGEFCKAILCRNLGIDMLIDDFGGYV
jgi:hypothetical protein